MNCLCAVRGSITEGRLCPLHDDGTGKSRPVTVADMHAMLAAAVQQPDPMLAITVMSDVLAARSVVPDTEDTTAPAETHARVVPARNAGRRYWQHKPCEYVRVSLSDDCPSRCWACDPRGRELAPAETWRPMFTLAADQ